MMNSTSLPKHVAIIMDGNGRWAKIRFRNRVFGHIKGARVAKKIIEHSVSKGLEALTLYAFSEENWDRPKEEVQFLMTLLGRYIVKERNNLVRNNIRFRCIGQIEKLPEAVRLEVDKTIQATSQCSGMILTFALSYGGRQELTQAVKSIAQLVEDKKISTKDINETLINHFLQTHPLPDPDLLIRTSGEWRLSNFLPWQTVYSELYFTDILWPEFTIKEYEKALISYQKRERRFGKIKSNSNTVIETHTNI